MAYEFQPGGERGELWHQLYAPNLIAANEVGLSEWRTSQRTLSTFGTDGVILAAVNADTHTGLLSHTGTPDQDAIDTDAAELFEHALAEIPRLGPAHSTLIRLAAAGIYYASSSDRLSTQRTREYTETMARKMAETAGIPDESVRTEWLDSNLQAGVRVNPSLGTITVREITLT